jgi:tRNA nucleotidyltransferase (CCA-adding enzyme)
MRRYVVGGAVRDELLGQPASDRDWVVVGATPQQMIELGYVPVGRDFPVFLHPTSHEEHALARTERKTARGYHGFVIHAAPDVTLEQDLARRDLTINAIARDPDSGELIDPFGGRADIEAGVLRHVSDAFAEDPVRILRVARFAARWPSFHVAPPTLALMQRMTQAGEVDALVPERVWQEVSRGLMEGRPSRMLQVLRECGALVRIAPEVDKLWGVPQPPQHHPEIDCGVHLMMVLDCSARLAAPLAVRYACLGHDLGKGSTPAEEWPRHIAHEARSVALVRALSARWRVPTDAAQLAEAVAAEHGNVHRSLDLSPAATVRLLQRLDAFRRPQRFEQVLVACECDARGRTGFEDAPYPQRPWLEQALAAANRIDTAAIAAAVPDQSAIGAAPTGAGAEPKGTRIAQAIHAARVARVAEVARLAPPARSAAGSATDSTPTGAPG